MHALYALASWMAFLVLLPALLLHPRLRHGQRCRLGLYPPRPGAGRPRIWLHGASAGDLLALQPIAAELKRRLPGCWLTVTTVTDSGLAMGRRRLPEADEILYAPWDLPGATRRAVRRLAPDLLVLEYAEIWPNLIRAARRGGARIALTNGRFSPRRVPRYRALFRAIGNPLRHLDLLLMRSEEEAARAVALGADPARVRVTGNTKLDALAASADADAARAAALRADMGLRPGAPVLMAGSTHDGEEAPLLAVYGALLRRRSDLQLVLAPRYLERCGRVMALAVEAGFSARLRSGGAAAGHAQVTVLDTIGELSVAYRLATLVFVGGSFVRRGGQNPFEPAGQGRPVLFGPHMENFEDGLPLLVGRGAIQVGTPEHLLRVADELLARPEEAAALGAMARDAVSRIRGATARDVDGLLGLLAGAEARP